jgi:hypothetical protein
MQILRRSFRVTRVDFSQSDKGMPILSNRVAVKLSIFMSRQMIFSTAGIFEEATLQM